MMRIGGAVLFWIAVALIQKFNWDLGIYKALVMAVLLGALPVAAIAARDRARTGSDKAPGLLVGAVAALLLLQTGYALKETRHPGLIDTATTTLAATETLAAGANPYAARLDASAATQLGDERFAGYKYLPMTIAGYAPLGAALGERGVVLTNLLLHLATVWLVFRLAGEMAGPGAGWLAALLYLSLPMVPFQLFAKGVVDPVAVVPLLAALLLVERNAAAAGLCVGLSLSAKLLPGALLLPCCLPAASRARLAYTLGIAVGLVPILPFVIADPRALFDNIVVFNLLRPADSTSWLFFAPAWFATLAHLALAGLLIASLVRIWRRPPALALRCGLGAALILATILAGPVAHHNYQLWWLPLMAALIGAVIGRRRTDFAGTADKARG
jgi:hypothetical protein